MITVILSGGSGSRLWPLSRQQHPKQFLPIVDEQTLFQSTISRLKGFSELEEPLIVCNEQHRFIVAEELRKLNSGNKGIILEPFGRNTAPAIALAAFHISKINPDELMLILPADHLIRNEDAFHSALKDAELLAKDGYLLTFGIVPSTPEIGYGYIHAEQPLSEDGLVLKVESFVEKPDLASAESYLNHGGYFWNSGMFLFRADSYLEALEDSNPKVFRACQSAMQNVAHDGDFLRVNSEAFDNSPDISIDYAVMEHTNKAAVVPLDASWSDVGAWPAVWEVGTKDKDGNVSRGDTSFKNSNNNLVYGEKSLVVLIGVDDLVVIDTKDATLVAARNNMSEIKTVVEQLKIENRTEAVCHREVFRPWGSYDSVDNGDRFQVKRISVNPGETLSLQKHHHRAEHWIVVSGTAEVTCDDNVFLLTENQSAYIPLGAVHRLSNPGKVILELIEVQSGSYLGEDDIVRFEDEYGRSEERF